MPIDALPTPPSRQDPANFAARADALLTALPTFVTQANALQTDVNTKQAQAATSQANAATSEGNALASKNVAVASEANAIVKAAAVSADKAATVAAKDTALAQAGLAAASAASAASVLQQDLSAISAALHRSPNAITAQFIYDTSKDSDGGAWTERMQHTSWYNEPLNGAWLTGGFASEAAARAATGAATGAYFQLTTDGKFYKLNAGAGTTEVFRGNKAKFPRLAAIVAEASNVTVYDLTEAGRPMWMRFIGVGTTGATSALLGSTTDAADSIATANGTLIVGISNSATVNGIRKVDFAADAAFKLGAGVYYTTSGGIANRNSGTKQVFGTSSFNLANNTIYAVAMTVLPDAPIDVATGLQVPTIAVATAGGVSVIKHDGTVANTQAWGTFNIAFDGRGNAVNIGENNRNLRKALAPGFTQVLGYSGTPFPNYVGAAGDTSPVELGGLDSMFAKLGDIGVVGRLRGNDSATGASLHAEISGTYNTGHMVGDIRRAYLANTEVESITAQSLVTGDSSTFTAGVGAWVPHGTGGDVAASGGEGVVTAPGWAGGQLPLGVLTHGKTYVVSADLYSNAAGVGQVTVGDYDYGSTNTATLVAYSNCPQVKTRFTTYLTVKHPDAYIGVTSYQLRVHGGNGGTVYVDNVSVDLAVPDRSYKAQGANIVGSLTKSAVATSAQLVAYSGWSAANYAQEPYSTDLDFGAGEWSVGAWVNFSTAVASVIAERSAATGPTLKLGTDATGKLTATAYDGTTTRTVTTDAAYNTGVFTKATAHYLVGKLSINVNGVEVASTSGAALLTMNNATAVLTIGNSRTLDAPFPGTGQICLLKIGATVPTPEQSLWAYEQEKQMFRDGAQVTLPAATPVIDLSYDEAQDKWVALQAGNESSFTGLIRTSTNVPSAGSFAKVSAQSGVKLLARTTTNPGVDVSIQAFGLREEQVKRGERAAALSKPLTGFEFDTASFTASTTDGSDQLTSVASVVGTPYVGMGISGTGIPAGTYIKAINGATYTASANATATGATVAMGQTDFTLPAGYQAKAVISAGALKREGATKDFTRLFDGFRETIRFATTPGSAVWVQINAVKESS